MSASNNQMISFNYHKQWNIENGIIMGINSDDMDYSKLNTLFESQKEQMSMCWGYCIILQINIFRSYKLILLTDSNTSKDKKFTRYFAHSLESSGYLKDDVLDDY
jgi:hypothetical protein